MSRKANTVVSVLGFEPFRVGGGESLAREISLQLAGRGWRSVLCFLTAPSEPVRRFLQLPNVSIEVVPDSWKLAWRPAWELARILRRYQPRILHLYFTGFLSPYPRLAKLLGTEQIFFTDQGSRPEGYQPRRAPAWKRLLTRVVSGPLDRIICPSEYNRRCWLDLGVLPERRFVRIYNGVDLSQTTAKQSAFRRRFAIPPDRPLVVQVSWIIPEKGFPELLEAARIVVSRRPEVHFAFVGEGEYRQQYMEKTIELGLRNNVTWTGLVEDPMAEGAYFEADVVCQASRWEEAFGYVIAEAMAFSKPVIAARTGGIPELVSDGETGFLVERRDAPALAERILLLLADRSTRERMGQAGRQKFEEKFCLQKNVSSLLEYYTIVESR